MRAFILILQPKLIDNLRPCRSRGIQIITLYLNLR